MREALRLAFGTLTVLPVRPPARVDSGVAGWAMALSPLVGTALGLVAALVTWLLAAVLDPLLVAVLVVVLLGLATRLIHWDGLADTADGLGSARPADAALEVMRRSDIGPFGVFAVVAVLGLQVAALAALLAQEPTFFAVTFEPGRPGEAIETARPVGAVVVAAVLGRLALVVGCRSGTPAARRDGLGAAVAGTVGVPQAATGVLVVVLALTLVAVLDPSLAWGETLVAAGAALVWAVGTTAYLRRRLGGMTGDTLGALVETTTAVALVVLAAG